MADNILVLPPQNIQISISNGSHSCFAYNNTAYGNDVGIGVRGHPLVPRNNMTNNIVKNNISFGNTVREFSALYGGENDGVNGSGNVYEYNCLGPEGANFIEWGDGVYKCTYDAWETAYGSCTNSVEADPSFTDAANSNFTLQPLSPCIDAGIDVGLSTDYIQTSIPKGNGIDIGALEYKNISHSPPRNFRILK